MEDPIIYKRQPILNVRFETPTVLSLLSTQKEHVNATLNTQVIFTRDGEVQQILIC
jgi:hypothetical protein